MSVSPMMIVTRSTGTPEIGDNLREAGLVALAARLRADHDVDHAFGLDGDFGALLRRADGGIRHSSRGRGRSSLPRVFASRRRASKPSQSAMSHAPVHVRLILAAVVGHADRRSVGHRLRRRRGSCGAARSGRSRVRGGRVDQPLDRESHFRPAGAAIGVGRHRVGEDRARPQRRRRECRRSR